MQVQEWNASNLREYQLYRSPRKFEPATFNVQGLHELDAALKYLSEIGMEQIECQVLRLSSRLWHGLASLNVRLITPPDTSSGIVTFLTDDAQKIEQICAENQIVVTIRGDHVRVSPHFFNTEHEIDRFLEAVSLC
jgi:selenocysteine lyase/cysteine desulfurase